MSHKKEWCLFGLMVLLIAVSVSAAWLSVPELAPAAVTYITPEDESAEEPATATDPLTVSLNSATEEELMQIDGIGEKTAQSIVEYRESHGGFHSVEELLNVRGIGEKRLEKWRPYLTL